MNNHDEIVQALEQVRNTIKAAKMSGKFLMCPVCGYYNRHDWIGLIIYRSSDRSQTMKCQSCGFQFTFTYHKLLPALRHTARARQKRGLDTKMSTFFADCIEAIKPSENRGKKRGGD